MPIDEAWSWIEGLRGGKWIPLYCYRANDETRLKMAFSFIQREHASEGKIPDGLREFSRFRIHPAGTYMEAHISIKEIRQDIGTENLIRILSKFNQTECGVIREKTGQSCRLPLFHEGKHSHRKVILKWNLV